MDNEEERMIWTEHLSKSYGEKEAVCDLTLEIRRGEIFGLLGPNGAGKTTTTLMLLGLTEPTGGSAYIDGKNCARQAIDVKRMVGYLPDNVGFYSDMTGRENLRFTGRLNGLPGDVTDRRIEELLEKVGMTEAADQKTGTYSRGMRQRLGIADVLMKDPKVVIMDEPTKGVDVGAKAEIYAIMGDLAKKGYAIILISSEMPEILGMSDRIVVMCNGRKTGELGRGEATQEMILELAMEKGTTGKGAAK